MDITHKIYVPVERINFEENDLPENVTYLFLRNHRRLFYSLNEKPDITHRNKHSISNYERRFKIVCHPHNFFSIFINICFG